MTSKKQQLLLLVAVFFSAYSKDLCFSVPMQHFFKVVEVSAPQEQEAFDHYCKIQTHRLGKKTKKQKSFSESQLREQALCHIDMYHSDWMQQVENDPDFLLLYAFFNQYSKEKAFARNKTIFRLGSYIKDTIKVYAGWFKRV